MKKQVGTIDAVPSKRLFLSIIADYDLNRSICELIDNALDIWIMNGRTKSLAIRVELEENQQTIRVEDNAGGLRKTELKVIVGPGQTTSAANQETIGIFGVGTKRAVVALAQDIKIKTRYKQGETYQIEFDETWLKNESWELPVYKIDHIPADTTVIELQRLRLSIDKKSVEHLIEHLQATYSQFLSDKKINIFVNESKLYPITFDDWAYPPSYEPRKYYGNLYTKEGSPVRVKVLAGLILESSPTSGEYGVYFYCNDRLIARGLKSYDVGFTKGLAGRPHPSISLTRVIIFLNGEAQFMPWNSSKSAINPNHHVFIALRSWLVKVVKDYASLSRRLEGDWHDRVFKYAKGDIIAVKIPNFPTANKSYLPPLPQAKPRYADIVIHKNRRIATNKPWTKGLYEGIIAVDLILKQNLEQKNRISLIILDSTLEIAFKEYLVNESGTTFSDTKLYKIFQNRNEVEAEVKKHIDLPEDIWNKIKYYYKLRCKLVHERSTVGIADTEIDDYRKVVQKILTRLFKLKFNR